jgi:2',3'-cyclic-nucleotide 2'-phosphodiesterase (5'-nucleotidase family)
MDVARAEADGLLALDAGDLFMPPVNRAPGLLPPDPGEVERRGRLLAAAMGRIGVAAFTPGERDLALGLPTLRRLLGGAKIPAVAANLYDRKGRRVFAADRLVEVAGLKVGLFGVIGAMPEDAEQWKAWCLEARDPVAAARAEVASLRARGAAIVIALLHVGAITETRQLLAAAPGIDWAVLGHTGMNLDEPELAGGARMLEAMTMGKHIGRLDLHIVGGDATGVIDRGRRAQLATILADHQRQLADTRQRAAETPAGPGQEALRKYHQGRVAELEK